jgi:hypothetical protein
MLSPALLNRLLLTAAKAAAAIHRTENGDDSLFMFCVNALPASSDDFASTDNFRISSLILDRISTHRAKEPVTIEFNCQMEVEQLRQLIELHDMPVAAQVQALAGRVLQPLSDAARTAFYELMSPDETDATPQVSDDALVIWKETVRIVMVDDIFRLLTDCGKKLWTTTDADALISTTLTELLVTLRCPGSQYLVDTPWTLQTGQTFDSTTLLGDDDCIRPTLRGLCPATRTPLTAFPIAQEYEPLSGFITTLRTEITTLAGELIEGENITDFRALLDLGLSLEELALTQDQLDALLRLSVAAAADEVEITDAVQAAKRNADEAVAQSEAAAAESQQAASALADASSHGRRPPRSLVINAERKAETATLRARQAAIIKMKAQPLLVEQNQAIARNFKFARTVLDAGANVTLDPFRDKSCFEWTIANNAPSLALLLFKKCDKSALDSRTKTALLQFSAKAGHDALLQEVLKNITVAKRGRASSLTRRLPKLAAAHPQPTLETLFDKLQLADEHFKSLVITALRSANASMLEALLHDKRLSLLNNQNWAEFISAAQTSTEDEDSELRDHVQLKLLAKYLEAISAEELRHPGARLVKERAHEILGNIQHTELLLPWFNALMTDNRYERIRDRKSLSLHGHRVGDTPTTETFQKLCNVVKLRLVEVARDCFDLRAKLLDPDTPEGEFIEQTTSTMRMLGRFDSQLREALAALDTPPKEGLRPISPTPDDYVDPDRRVVRTKTPAPVRGLYTIMGLEPAPQSKGVVYPKTLFATPIVVLPSIHYGHSAGTAPLPCHRRTASTDAVIGEQRAPAAAFNPGSFG